MGSRLAATAVAVALAALLAPTARAQDADADEGIAMKPRAHEHLVLGLTYYEDKDYEAAIREFRAGYAIDPRPELLFAIAQAERLSGDCPSALEAYALFLDRDPPEGQARAARQSIERCRTALGLDPGAEADPAPKREPAPEPSPPRAPDPDPEPAAGRLATSAPASSDSMRTPWYRDKVGAGLLGAGVVAAGVGVGFYVASASDESAADEAATYGDYVDLMDRAQSRRRVAWIGMAAGAGLVSGALVRYWLRDDDRSADRGVAIGATGDGASIVYTGRF